MIHRFHKFPGLIHFSLLFKVISRVKMSGGFLLASTWGRIHGPFKSLSDKSRHKAQRKINVEDA